MQRVAPKAPGQISPGQSAAPPRGGEANGSESPVRATQTIGPIVSPFQGSLAALIGYPGRRLASPCPGLICLAPSGQTKDFRSTRSIQRKSRVAPWRDDDPWSRYWSRARPSFPPAFGFSLDRRTGSSGTGGARRCLSMPRKMAVGCRVRSYRGVQFRTWATERLRAEIRNSLL